MIIHYIDNDTDICYADMNYKPKTKEDRFRDIPGAGLKVSNFNRLSRKHRDTIEMISNLEWSNKKLEEKMYEELIYPYTFGDKVTLKVFPPYAPLNPEIYKGVLEYSKDKSNIIIREIKKNGGLSTRTHTVLFQDVYFELCDYDYEEQEDNDDIIPLF